MNKQKEIELFRSKQITESYYEDLKIQDKKDALFVLRRELKRYDLKIEELHTKRKEVALKVYDLEKDIEKWRLKNISK